MARSPIALGTATLHRHLATLGLQDVLAEGVLLGAMAEASIGWHSWDARTRTSVDGVSPEQQAESDFADFFAGGVAGERGRTV